MFNQRKFLQNVASTSLIVCVSCKPVPEFENSSRVNYVAGASRPTEPGGLFKCGFSYIDSQRTYDPNNSEPTAHDEVLFSSDCVINDQFKIAKEPTLPHADLLINYNRTYKIRYNFQCLPRSLQHSFQLVAKRAPATQLAPTISLPLGDRNEANQQTLNQGFGPNSPDYPMEPRDMPVVEFYVPAGFVPALSLVSGPEASDLLKNELISTHPNCNYTLEAFDASPHVSDFVKAQCLAEHSVYAQNNYSAFDFDGRRIILKKVHEIITAYPEVKDTSSFEELINNSTSLSETHKKLIEGTVNIANDICSEFKQFDVEGCRWECGETSGGFSFGPSTPSLLFSAHLASNSFDDVWNECPIGSASVTNLQKQIALEVKAAQDYMDAFSEHVQRRRQQSKTIACGDKILENVW